MSDTLSIQDLSVTFTTDDGTIQAVDRVSLTIQRGEILGLVGESGCGKSVTAMSIPRLIPQPPGRITSGRILFDDQNLLRATTEELHHIRGKRIGMIFQEPMTALSPLHSIGKQMAEALRIHQRMGRREALGVAHEWLEKVGIPDPHVCLGALPHQLSGGMRQRVMIASALMLNPDLVIADEPTTALDVTIQAQIFDLIRRMKDAHTSVLLITHDMGVIWEMCSRVAVMYAGQIVEIGGVEDIFQDPLHPYTRALLASIPSTHKAVSRLPVIPGQVPPPMNYPHGCRFQDRCRYTGARCRAEAPPLYPHDGRYSRCVLMEDNP